jgi:hypothetical protein
MIITLLNVFEKLVMASFTIFNQEMGGQRKALRKLGNIVAETFVILDVSSNVSMFAHLWKHCCGNKICFPRSKNVS